MIFEDFVKDYGSQKDKIAYSFSKEGGGEGIIIENNLSPDFSSGIVQGGSEYVEGSQKGTLIPPSTVKNMIKLKKMLDFMINKSTESNKDEMTTPWMIAKNIAKLMKQAYTSSGKSFAPHSQSIKYTASLFILYIILSTFKWIPSKSKPTKNTEETKEEKQARVNREKNRDEKNRLIFTLVKVILVVSVMLT
jgi:predicted nucleic acid-binding Zn ribbon protein